MAKEMLIKEKWQVKCVNDKLNLCKYINKDY